ncbi:MAG: DUF1508 domain-containing protein [Rhizobiaceae bacterium]|nr:DUF1508 domain-containing protein [Rhizobiaceae bacterium]MCV0407179.1 DUF1508 domain-containing protein [Rhizobiaceae bacterium]
MSKFEVYKDKKGETRFRFVASNGEPMFASEGYKTRASAMKAIDSIKKNVPAAPVEEVEGAKPKKSVVGRAASKVKNAASAVAAPIAGVVSGKTSKSKAAAATKAETKPKAAAKSKAPAKANTVASKKSGKSKAAASA